MKKLRTLLRSPLLTNSGYGRRGQELFLALVADKGIDLHVESVNWGNCSFNTEDSDLTRAIKHCVQKYVLAKQQGQDKEWDLFVTHTIANEFERRGKVNVGVTAGVEVDRVSHVWVQKINEMDLVIVSSEHSKKAIQDTTVEWENPQTKERGTFKVNKHVVVCPEAVDTSIFKMLDRSSVNLPFDFEPDFNFLCIGQWGKGGFGEDRKNIANTIRFFIESFLGRKDVGLVLKINMARNTQLDYEMVLQRIKEIKVNFKEEDVPPIYLLHANLTNQEMAQLYNHPKIKAMLTLTNGEGFCRPLLEAAACGLPVMATNWSGQLDFLNKGKWVKFDYDLKEIPEVAVWDNILIKDSKWANVNPDDVKRKMQKIVSSYSNPEQWGKELSTIVSVEYNLQNVAGKFLSIIGDYYKNNVIKSFNPKQYLEEFIDTPDSFNVFYSMPMSTGDVYLSTAVLDGLAKQLPPEAKLYFSTKMQYMEVLKNNPHVYKVIPWEDWMLNMDLLNEVFDAVFSPNVATQYNFSNWIHGAHSRLLAEEFANHCQVDLGDYFVDKDDCIVQDMLKDKVYMTFHPTSGQGQWEGRNYKDWEDVLKNLKELYPELTIVQVGSEDEGSYKYVDVDLRGQTTFQQLASILENSVLHLSPDTATMHMAVSLNVPTVSIFGCSSATSTGPWVKDKQKAKYILLQSERRSGCVDKPCYKNRCAKSSDGSSPINEIDSFEIFQACTKLLKERE